MAVSSFSASCKNTTLAYFNAWGGGFSAAIQAVGLVQTADTGQIDWTTNTVYPANTSGVSVGYEIYRFNDSLQSTTPVFIKIEYGSLGTISESLGFAITIGKGSDGAGNITDIQFPRLAFGTAGSSTTSYLCFASGSLGRLALGSFIGGISAYLIMFAVERHHDATGVDVSGGINVITSMSTTRTSTCCNWDTASPAKMTAWNTAVPPSGSGAASPDINAYPVRTWIPGESYPLHSAFSYVSTDFTTGATYSVTNYDDVARTYIACGVTNVSYGGTGYALLRYD